VIAEIVDGENVGMVERRHGLRLALEADARSAVVGEARGQHLDRDFALEPRVACAIHFAHPACAERGDERVVTECVPRTQAHRR
jgi:hypothetical protein